MNRIHASLLVLLLATIVSCGRSRPIQGPQDPEFTQDHSVDQDRNGGLLLSSPEEIAQVRKAGLILGNNMRLAREVDLSRKMPPPGNQVTQSSCVGWSVAWAIKSYHEVIEEKWSIFQNNGRLNYNRVFSPAFLYNSLCRSQTSGLNLYRALKWVKSNGIAPWSHMPFNHTDWQTKPSAAAKKAAKRYRIDDFAYIQPNSVAKLKGQLAGGNPIVFAVMVSKEFKNLRGANSVWKTGEGGPGSGHAMVLVGYSDSRKAFRVINSWGTRWGDRGYCWIPYYRVTDGLLKEAFVLLDAENGATESVVDKIDNPSRGKTWFTLDNVRHNVKFSGSDENFMEFNGNLEVPAGRAKKVQVGVFFYIDRGNMTKGEAMLSNNDRYQSGGGAAACGTNIWTLGPSGLRKQWTTSIPAAALIVPENRWKDSRNSPGRQYCDALLEAALFVDDYRVSTAKLVAFNVTRAKPKAAPVKLTRDQASDLFNTAYEQHGRGDYANSITNFKRIFNSIPKDSLGQAAAYNVACAYALQGRRRDALDWLDTAIKSGYRNFAHIEEDSDLDSIRGDRRYREILNRYGHKPPVARIHKVDVKHNVVQNQEKGMEVHVNFDVDNLKARKGFLAGYFYFSDGTRLKDSDGRYNSDDGTVSSGREFTPGFDNANYKDLTFFIPYDQLHLVKKGTHKMDMYVEVFGWVDGKWKTLTKNWRYSFQVKY